MAYLTDGHATHYITLFPRPQADQTNYDQTSHCSHIWIALYSPDAADLSSWTWADSSLISYNAWSPGEPNLSGEACARMAPSIEYHWADTLCDTSYAYICQG